MNCGHGQLGRKNGGKSLQPPYVANKVLVQPVFVTRLLNTFFVAICVCVSFLDFSWGYLLFGGFNGKIKKSHPFAGAAKKDTLILKGKRKENPIGPF